MPTRARRAKVKKAKRPSAAKRGYGRPWQKASKEFLRRRPICAQCRKDGRTTAAAVVDHKTPHKGDQRLFWDVSNWQPLCKRCHDVKTAREQYGQRIVD